MESSNFASLDAEVANDISGTESEPRLVRVLTGKCGKGVVFVIKIGNLYFDMWQKSTAKKWILSEPHSRRVRLSDFDRSICYKNLQSTSIFTMNIFVKFLGRSTNNIYGTAFARNALRALYQTA